MKNVSLLLSIILLFTANTYASVTGSIQGTVTDATGRVIPGAAVVATNIDMGLKVATTTNESGVFTFAQLNVGHYTVSIHAAGFADLRETGINLEVNAVLRVDAALKVTSVAEQVEVEANPVQVDSVSTQLGDVIGGDSMTSLPLNGRSYTDLLALQPGVAPQSNEGSNNVNSYSNAPPSGGLNDGSLSIGGARGSSNGFMVNGGNVQEQLADGTAIIPNVDSISEFRIITNNFDAEYGHYSGGLINVITKSGTNQIHGDAFDFLRNTDLDARNYYAPSRTGYHQNQFGGTFGDRILREKLFFFTDYQGTRQSIGELTNETPVPSATDRQGNLLDQAGLMTGSVIGPAFAQTLTSELGHPVTVGEPFYTSSCTSANGQCVFPNAVIPQSVWSPAANSILQFVPAANIAPSANYPTGAYVGSADAPLHDDKGAIRVDANTRTGTWSGYYFIDQYALTNPFPLGQSSANTFGNFGGATQGRAQLITLSNAKPFGTNRINEFRVGYTRDGSNANAPTGPAVDLGSLGFTVGCNTEGICPQNPNYKTLPTINFNNFTLGGPTGSESLHENTFQVQDNYSWTHGSHNLKFGGLGTLSQVNMFTQYANDGLFIFNGSGETGLDLADFLLGVTTSYQQGVQLPLYNRTKYWGLFAQDSWTLSPHLTVNYGLRWDVSMPWAEKYNRAEALIPGKQSAVFPTAPTGWLVPGDKGVPRTVANTQYSNFSPRVGFAYSPDAKTGILQSLLGGSGKSSIRGSFGIFYGDMEDYVNANGNGDAPYGLFWVGPTPENFTTPFVDVYTGNQEGQRFPIPSNISSASLSNPDSSVNWAQFEPISSSPTFYYRNVTPYSESWMLSIQRQFLSSTVLTVSYVGTAGKHLMVIDEANPSTPSVCLSVSQASEVAPGSNVCGPNSETGLFTEANGTPIEARQQLGPMGGVDFGSTGWFRTMGSSSFNALESSLQYRKKNASLLVAYTYSKSLDDSSAATEQVQPFNPQLEHAISTFNVPQNFVASYSYELPFDQLLKHSNQLTKGWVLSGITRFAKGFPITILENDDRSLIGNTSPGPTGDADEPNIAPGKILSQTNPRKGGTYFNTSLFSLENIGQFGDARRRFFTGPGWNNFDTALEKQVHLTEADYFEFRFEFFNVFNHTQFGTPSGLINGSTFGVVNTADTPRIGQVAAKFYF